MALAPKAKKRNLAGALRPMMGIGPHFHCEPAQKSPFCLAIVLNGSVHNKRFARCYREISAVSTYKNIFVY
jgi:hypothetical protein